MSDDVPLAVKELTAQPDFRIVSPPWETYYLVVYLVCVAMVEAASLSLASRVVASVALALMVPWYLLVGRPVMVLDEVDWLAAVKTWRGPVYLSGMIALFILVVIQDTDAWFLAFVLTAQCFHVATIRRGMAFVVVMNGTAGLIMAVQYPDLQNTLEAIGFTVFAVGFAFVYSTFTARIIMQNLERAALIEQLTETRHELAAAHHEAGVLAERHRLAGEIHDTLAQGFTSIVTLIQAAEADLRPEQSQSKRLLALARATARDNLAEARALVAALTPVDLSDIRIDDASRLGDALSRVTSATGAEAGIGAESQVEGTARPLPTGTEVVLLRVCQEALANVRKHAHASTVSVRLRYGDDAIQLEVADDGRGFITGSGSGSGSGSVSGSGSGSGSGSVNGEAGGGYGLRGMRDRVQQVGGTVQVTSTPGAGTRISAEVPG
jgi:signal transduction histidine kinase